MGYRRTLRDEYLVVLNYGAREGLDGVGLDQCTLMDLVSPRSWVSMNAVTDTVLHDAGVDPAEWPVWRVVSYYRSLEQMQEQADSATDVQGPP